MSQRRGLLRSNPFADARRRDGKDAKEKQNFDHLRTPVRSEAATLPSEWM